MYMYMYIMGLKLQVFVGKSQNFLKCQQVCTTVLILKSYIILQHFLLQIFFLTFASTEGFIFAQEHESLPSKVGGAEYMHWNLLVLVAKSTLPLILENILDDPLMFVLKTIGEFIFISHLVISMKTF